METLTNAIAIFFILHFCWSYYWNCYRKGYTIDIWHLTLLNLVFVIHVMLPFVRSPLNVIALGGLVTRTQAHVTEAYLISAFGYAGMLVGGNLWRIRLGLGTRQWVSRVLELPTRGAILLLRSRAVLLTHGTLAIILVTGVVLFYFSVSGFGFNMRGLWITYPAFRPIAVFTAFYAVLVASHCLARYVVFKERAMLIIVLVVAFGLLFFGARSVLVGIVLLVAQVGALRMGRRLKIWWFVAAMAGTIVVVFLLNGLRSQNLELQGAVARFGMETFYGNSFSDTRDFALVLSFWDGHYFYGLTYLAAILSFIPRALSTFRDTWSLGVVTATMAGYNPTQHPGLRVGTFGEAFLNFGLPGVLALSLLVGAVTRFVDLRMKQALAVLPERSLRVYSYLMIISFLGAAEISIGFSMLYSILLIFGISAVFVWGLRLLKIGTAGV